MFWLGLFSKYAEAKAVFTLLTCQLNATPEVAALRPPYESMTTSAAATLFISSSFSLSLLLSFCSRSKCQICNVPGQLPQKGKIRVGPLRSSPSVGSVRLGLVNWGANLLFPVHCRWGERNISPNPASKIQPLVINRLSKEPSTHTCYFIKLCLTSSS